MDIQTAKQMISAAALADDAVIMEGVHGIGKSQIVKQFAKENDYHIEELFLSHQEVGDLIGIPHTVEKDGATLTMWSVPIWLQRMNDAANGGKRCVLFLDELNRAPIDVRQSALQLVLERQLHEHILPTFNGERTLIVAATNPASDYQVDELDPALLDRFLFLQVEPDAPAWLKYSREANLNAVVRDFIKEFPDRLHFTPAEGTTGSSPRSWEKLAAYLDENENIPKEILFQVMKGKIGTEVASQFYSFYENYVDVIKVEDIEQLIEENKDRCDNIEDLAELISDLMSGTEAIQKSDMIHQFTAKYMDQDDIYPVLVYLYSLEVEICVAFLKSYRNDEPKKYKKIAEIDDKVNNKNLFKRIVQASDKK